MFSFTPSSKPKPLSLHIQVAEKKVTVLIVRRATTRFYFGSTVEPYHCTYQITFPKGEMMIKKAIVSQAILFVIDTEGRLYSCKYVEHNYYGNVLKRVDAIDECILDMVGNNTHLFLIGKSRVYGMGKNDFGQLGLGHLDNVQDFVPLTFFDRINMNSNKYRDNVVKIACGDAFTLFITNTQKVYACGSNYYGQQTFTDNSVYLSTPQRITTTFEDVNNVVDIYCGRSYSLFKLSNGSYIGFGQFKEGGKLKNTKIIPELQQFDSIDSVYCLANQIIFTTKFTKTIVAKCNGFLSVSCDTTKSDDLLLFCNEKTNKMMLVQTDNKVNIKVSSGDEQFASITFNNEPNVKVNCNDDELIFYKTDYLPNTEKSTCYLISEKAKKFKLPSDTIQLDSSNCLYTFLAFIQIRNPSFFALLKQDNLINTENSLTILQDLVSFCFSEDCSFVKKYSSFMIAELLYYLERMRGSYDDFTAPLIYLSVVHISKSEGFDPIADKFIRMLIQEGIVPKIYGGDYATVLLNKKGENLPTIESCLEKLFNSDTADTTIIIDQFGFEKIKCHRSVLIAQSTFFEAFYTGHFASDEINLFNDGDVVDDNLGINFEEMSDEERQLLIDPESQIKTRALKNILMMFYGLEPAVENDLVISMLDIAHKFDAEHLVMKCLKMFETSLDEESLQVVNQWLSGVEEKTDVQQLILKSADNWSNEISQRNILFQNAELENEFSKDIGILTHSQIDKEFTPNVTTHYVANTLDKENYDFLCAVAGNCAIVKPEYIRKSIESQCWINEEPYLFNKCATDDLEVQTLLKVNQDNRALKTLVFSQVVGQVILRKQTKSRVERLIMSGGGKIDNFYANLVLVNKNKFSKTKKIGSKCQNFEYIDYRGLINILMGLNSNLYRIYNIEQLARDNLEKKKRKRNGEDK